MKKSTFPILLTLFLFSITFHSRGQETSLVFFSGQGEPFSVLLNGILQNGQPESNVRITDLPATSYRLRILFEDPKIQPINKTVMFGKGNETTFCIRKKHNGGYGIRVFGQVPSGQPASAVSGQRILPYSATPRPNLTINQTQVINNNVTMSTSGPVSASPSPGPIINMGSPTMTTTITASNVRENGEINHQNTINPRGGHYEMPGYTGEIGCPFPMTDLDFRDAKQAIVSKSFDESRLGIAKQVVSANCLFSSEVKEIMELFSFESTRLEFAKFAYQYTFDLGNYYKVNEAFQFESSIDELNSHISGRRNR